MKDKSNFLTIGKVGRAHGLKGELRVISYADSPFIFDELSRIYLKKSAWPHPRKFTISSARLTHNEIYLYLQGVQGRDAVKELQGAELWIRLKDLPEKADEEIYLFELIGFSVFLPDNSLLGHISGVQGQSAQEIWVITDKQGREILFPAVDEFVLEVDVQKKSVQIDPPDGLIELYV